MFKVLVSGAGGLVSDRGSVSQWLSVFGSLSMSIFGAP